MIQLFKQTIHINVVYKSETNMNLSQVIKVDFVFIYAEKTY